MNWHLLTAEEQLSALHELSFTQPQVIFKHSTRCSISSVVKSRLERSVLISPIQFYLIDLIRYRSLSNQIAEKYHVFHESPQVLLIKNGECIYEESHYGIVMEDIVDECLKGS